MDGRRKRINAATTAERAQSTHVSTEPTERVRLSNILLGCTVFLSAFLLFLIEPLFAKLILPRFGGTAAVWATCLVFFQSALLLGYWYADVTTRRLPLPRQSVLHIALLVVSFCFLPVAPRAIFYAL